MRLGGLLTIFKMCAVRCGSPDVPEVVASLPGSTVATSVKPAHMYISPFDYSLFEKSRVCLCLRKCDEVLAGYLLQKGAIVYVGVQAVAGRKDDDAATRLRRARVPYRRVEEVVVSVRFHPLMRPERRQIARDKLFDGDLYKVRGRNQETYLAAFTHNIP